MKVQERSQGPWEKFPFLSKSSFPQKLGNRSNFQNFHHLSNFTESLKPWKSFLSSYKPVGKVAASCFAYKLLIDDPFHSQFPFFNKKSWVSYFYKIRKWSFFRFLRFLRLLKCFLGLKLQSEENKKKVMHVG